MAGLSFKHLKTLKIVITVICALFINNFLTGCASSNSNRYPASHDEPGYKLNQSAQNEWNNHKFEASSDYHFSLAQAYSNEGKVDRAIEEYQAALAYDPKSAVLHAKLAAEYLKKGSTSSAIDSSKLALQYDPDFVDVRLMLGGIYSMNGETESALAQYDAVLKVDPRNDEAAVFKTQVLVEKNREAEALKFIKKFVSKVDDSAAAWYYDAKLEQIQDHTNEAVRAYRKALDLRPGFSQATIALGMIFETHGDTQKALDLYQDQLEQKQDLQVAGRLAILYLKLNQMEAAQKTLEIMVLLDPEDLNTRLKLGLVHMQRHNWDKAKEVFVAVLKKVPDSDKVNYYLAAVYEEAGDYQHTVEHLMKVSPDSKLFEDAAIHAAGLYRKLTQKSNSYSVLEEAIKKSPENPGFYLALASLHEDDHELAKASSALTDGLKLFPDHEKLRYYHGAILDKLGQADEAVADMEKIVAQNPNHADALNFIAYTWTSQGVHLKDAEGLLKRALKLKPKSPFILDSLGWNQFMLGHAKEALIYLERAVSLKADEQAILEHLVEVYTRNQMPEQARATQNRIGKLIEKSSNEGTSEAFESRAPASVEEN